MSIFPFYYDYHYYYLDTLPRGNYDKRYLQRLPSYTSPRYFLRYV
jgi:hypothetical protein